MTGAERSNSGVSLRVVCTMPPSMYWPKYYGWSTSLQNLLHFTDLGSAKHHIQPLSTRSLLPLDRNQFREQTISFSLFVKHYIHPLRHTVIMPLLPKGELQYLSMGL